MQTDGRDGAALSATVRPPTAAVCAVAGRSSTRTLSLSVGRLWRRIDDRRSLSAAPSFPESFQDYPA